MARGQRPQGVRARGQRGQEEAARAVGEGDQAAGVHALAEERDHRAGHGRAPRVLHPAHEPAARRPGAARTARTTRGSEEKSTAETDTRGSSARYPTLTGRRRVTPVKRNAARRAGSGARAIMSTLRGPPP